MSPFFLCRARLLRRAVLLFAGPRPGSIPLESGLFIEEPKLSPDGRWLVYCHNNGGSSLCLLQLGNNPIPSQ
jgi:hypothetical protein